LKQSLFSQSAFKYFWFSRILSSGSYMMLSVAIGWQMYALTHDAFSLGLVGLAQFIPMVLLSFVVGQVADRFDRRKVVSLCQFIESGIAGLLLYGSFAGGLDREQMLFAAAVLGACRAFEGPTASALLPQLVSKSMLPQAISLSTTAGQTSQIMGPALGGILLSLGGSFVYGTALIALLIASFLSISIQMERTVRMLEPVSLRSIFMGLEFVFSKPIILGTISLDLFAVLLGGVTALLPIFAQDILQTGPWGLGLLRTSPAVGALLVSIVLGYFPLKKALGPTLFGALALFGMATILFAFSTNLILSLVALFLIGGSDVVSVVIRHSLVQLQTPDEMRGRVNAVNSLFVGTSNQLGEFRAGMVGGFFGAAPAALIGGLGTVAVAGLWMYFFPSLRRLKSLSEN
jgi:MFS family permease